MSESDEPGEDAIASLPKLPETREEAIAHLWQLHHDALSAKRAYVNADGRPGIKPEPQHGAVTKYLEQIWLLRGWLGPEATVKSVEAALKKRGLRIVKAEEE